MILRELVFLYRHKKACAAGRVLNERRRLNERERVRETAQRMLREMGKPEDSRLA
jgi:hypothetical protein